MAIQVSSIDVMRRLAKALNLGPRVTRIEIVLDCRELPTVKIWELPEKLAVDELSAVLTEFTFTKKDATCNDSKSTARA